MTPDIVNITEAKTSGRRDVDAFHYTKDTIVVDDRGYFDCKLFQIRIDDELLMGILENFILLFDH